MTRLEADVAAERPEIAVIAIPGEGAQEVLDRIVEAGIKAVLNFAPVQLHAPADVTVEGREHGDGAGRALVRADESRVARAARTPRPSPSIGASTGLSARRAKQCGEQRGD